MANITYHFEVSNKTNKQGRYPIFLRITQNRKLTRVKTGVSIISQKDWNAHPIDNLSYIRASEPQAQVLNAELEALLTNTKKKYNELTGNGDKDVSAVKLANTIRDKEQLTTNLLSFTKKYVQGLWKSGQIGNYKKYAETLNKLDGYVKSTGFCDVALDDIDSKWVEGYETYLKGLSNQRSKNSTLSENTRNRHLRDLRAILNKAIESGDMTKGNPIKGGIGDVAHTKKKLDIDGINALAMAELEAGSMKWNARNCFLFSYYCAGIRVGDLMQLRWSNVEGGRLTYVMDKSEKVKNIMLIPQATAILDLYRSGDRKGSQYIFPFLDSNAPYAKTNKSTLSSALQLQLFNTIGTRVASLNRALGQVAEQLGLGHISFHISRHSFARNAMDSGVDIEQIQGLLGHSSMAVTERYLRDDNNSKRDDEALAKMFGNRATNSPKEALLEQLKGLDKETLISLLMGLKTN